MDRELLIGLQEVGGKAVDCILCFEFGKDVIPVDIHVESMVNRLGFVNQDDCPEEFREKFHKFVLQRKMKIFNWFLVKFDKEICRTNNPRYEACPTKSYCRYHTKQELLRSRSG
jgi:endonuclease III